MKNNLAKSILFSLFALTSCGKLSFEASPVLKVNDNEIPLYTLSYIGDDGKGWILSITSPETKNNAQNCVHIVDSSSYKFIYNDTHEFRDLSLQYLDSEYNAIFTKEKDASSFSGLTKKNWYDADDGELGVQYRNYTYEDDTLIISHPTDDYKYIFVHGHVNFPNSHEQETYFYFVIEK